MECLHCGKSIPDEGHVSGLSKPGFVVGNWHAESIGCPACKRLHVKLVHIEVEGGNPKTYDAYPHVVGRKPKKCSAVPPSLFNDYTEACKVIELSPKASATLSRRCLQGILRDKGYGKQRLYDEIQALLDEDEPRRALPDYMHETIDSIRQYGNFGAHPPKNGDKLLEILDVDSGEAQFCIELIEELFTHFYEIPARLVAMRDEARQRREGTDKANSEE